MRLVHPWLVTLAAALCLAIAPGCAEEDSTATPQAAETAHDEHEHDHDHDHDHAHDADTQPTEQAAISGEREPGGLRVVVSTVAIRWPIDTLVSPEDDVVSLLAPGQSVHDFELTPENIKAIDRADLLVLVGLGLDEAVARVARNRPSPHREVLVLADIARNAGQLPQNFAEHDHDHDHGDESHAHADPHIWLLPTVMNIYALELGNALERAYTKLGRWEGEDRFRVLQEAGTAADSAAIADLSFATRLEAFIGQGVVSNHAAFGVFLEYYGLEEFAVLQPDPNVEPTPGDVQRVVDAIREHDLKGILVVPWHNRSAAERVSEMTGVPLITVDPIGMGDWPVLIDSWYSSLFLAITGAPPVRDE